MHVKYDPAAQGGNALSDDDANTAADAAAVAGQGESGASAAELDAFSAGVEEARQQEGGEPPPADDQAAPDGQPPADEAAPDPAADPAAAADDKGEQPAKPGAVDPAAVDKEMQELGITHERTKARFRELSERAAEAEALRPLAAKAQEWDETIQSTGASPEQFGQALNYLAAVNSGDPGALRQAHQFLTKEVEWLSKQLGLPVAGYDPLTDFPDLAEQVRNGDTTRELAEEVAANRRAQALQQGRQEQVQQLTEQQRQHQQALNEGVAKVRELGVRLRNRDADFAPRFAAIKDEVSRIQATLPPSEWVAAILEAYATAKPAAPVPPAPATPNPARPTGVSLAPTAAQDPFGFGVEEARARGL